MGEMMFGLVVLFAMVAMRFPAQFLGSRVAPARFRLWYRRCMVAMLLSLWFGGVAALSMMYARQHPGQPGGDLAMAVAKVTFLLGGIGCSLGQRVANVIALRDGQHRRTRLQHFR